MLGRKPRPFRAGAFFLLASGCCKSNVRPSKPFISNYATAQTFACSLSHSVYVNRVAGGDPPIIAILRLC